MEFALVLVGFGNVARRFVTLLEETAPRLPFTWRVVGIATARHGSAFDPAGLDARRAAALVEAGQSLADLGPDPAAAARPGPIGVAPIARAGRACAREAAEGRLVCVETTLLDIRDGEPAATHVRVALDAGAHVVSANKGPVACAYGELASRARDADRAFLFEGAVMDGIPVFGLVRESMPAATILGFRGVVNSTTNHIISALEDGGEFAEALARMQALGIAESDASLDVDGWDAAAKTAALMNVLMGASVTPRDIDRTGIGGLTGDQVRAAVARGERIRLVASAGREADRAVGRVAPEALPATDLLATLRGMENALEIRTDLLGEVAIVQKTGSLTQTAYALVADLATIARGSWRPSARQPVPE